MTSALMANVLGIETLMILTAVPQGRGQFRQAASSATSTACRLRELKRHQAEGQFPPGSMGPKIDAAIRFLEGGGERVIITDLDLAVPALQGLGGTQVTA